MKRFLFFFLIGFLVITPGILFSQNVSITGTVSAGTFSGTLTGTITTPAQPFITSLGTLTGLTVTGPVSFNNIGGTLTTAAQPNITSVGSLSGLTVINSVSAGSVSTFTVTNSNGVLQLSETGGEYGEAGLYIYNKTGSNGPIFYTNPTNPTIDLVDFGFLSQGSNSQTNLRFEHRSGSVLDASNTNGEMQFFHITNNGAAASPSTAFTGIGSATTTINSTSAIKLNGGTGASTFSTSGAGTLVLGGAASTGNITLGESTGTQTVNVGTGTGASTVNIATGATNGKTINIGTGAVANTISIGNTTGASQINMRAGTGQLNMYGLGPVMVQSGTGVTAGTALTAAQLLTGYLKFTGAAGNVTLPTAANIALALTGGAVTQGTSFFFTVDNSGGGGTCTIVVNTGITTNTPPITGGNTLTVSTANSVALFRIVFITASTAKIFRVH